MNPLITMKTKRNKETKMKQRELRALTPEWKLRLEWEKMSHF